ncbi:MAG: type II secretion system F family protein [Acidiferrobacterales bacterium]|nr:type II secretion system F family protein [Acidiferrobacterales bacterium]
MAKAKSKKSEPVSFTWSGVDKGNRKASGEIEATNIQAARLLLRRQGIRVKKLRKTAKPLLSLGSSVKVKDIVFTTRQLATMIEAGIPIAQSLRGISVGHDNPAVKTLLNKVRADVEAGTNLSVSLKKHPEHFNRLYTSLVSVGEESGTLDNLMNSIAGYLEKIENIKSKVRSALFYPALVILVAIVIVAVLLIVVIPEFETLFSDFGADLPSLTKWVVDLSHAVQANWHWYLLGAMIGGVFLVNAYKRSTKMQHLLDRMILKMPIFGPIIRKAIIARISRTLAIMFGAGIPLVDALETVASAAGNRVYRDGILEVRREVSTGRTLESSMADTKLFPGMMLQMVTTGEEAGELERMLDKVADFFENEVDNAVAVISSLIEPLLIIVLGVIVGTIVIAMYLPIFKLGAVF